MMPENPRSVEAIAKSSEVKPLTWNLTGYPLINQLRYAASAKQPVLPWLPAKDSRCYGGQLPCRMFESSRIAGRGINVMPADDEQWMVTGDTTAYGSARVCQRPHIKCAILSRLPINSVPWNPASSIIYSTGPPSGLSADGRIVSNLGRRSTMHGASQGMSRTRIHPNPS